MCSKLRIFVLPQGCFRLSVSTPQKHLSRNVLTRSYDCRPVKSTQARAKPRPKQPVSLPPAPPAEHESKPARPKKPEKQRKRKSAPAQPKKGKSVDPVRAPAASPEAQEGKPTGNKLRSSALGSLKGSLPGLQRRTTLAPL